MGSLELEPGTLLIAPPSEDDDTTFARAVVLIVDHEPNGIISGIVLNRPTEQHVSDASALALLFIPDLSAPAFWGGPMGNDPAILAEFTAIDGLEWFHLPKQQQRPFPLPRIGVIAVAEHPSPFNDRIRRARLYVGLCVWGAGQLEGEVERREWQLAQASAKDLFRPDPQALWADLRRRLTD